MIFPEERLECLLEVEEGGGELLECRLLLLELEACFFILELEGESGGENSLEERLDRHCSSPPIFSSPRVGDFDDLFVGD